MTEAFKTIQINGQDFNIPLFTNITTIVKMRMEELTPELQAVKREYLRSKNRKPKTEEQKAKLAEYHKAYYYKNLEKEQERRRNYKKNKRDELYDEREKQGITVKAGRPKLTEEQKQANREKRKQKLLELKEKESAVIE